MNENFKASLQRLTAWVKAHPYISILILAGVVFLAWLTIRRGGLSMGGSEEGEPGRLETETLDSLDMPPATPGAPGENGDMGGGSDTGNGSEGSGEVEPDPLDILQGGGQSIEDVPLASLPTDLYTSGISVTSPNAAALISPTIAARDIRAQPREKGTRIPSRPETARARTPSDAAQTLAQSSNVARVSAGEKRGGVKGGKVNIDTRARTSTQTPAERVGKSKYFTGVYLGVVYVAGYPINSQSKTTIPTTGTRGTKPKAR